MLLLLPTYNQNSLPISGLKKLGDLLNYDGPILSLFNDDLKQYYLFYWVDHDHSYNRWLVWKVKEENLYYYLTQEISLLDLLLFEDKDYVFSVDINDQLNYSNVTLIEVKRLPSDYLPETKSYYKLPLPFFAKNFTDNYEASDNYYKVLMKQKSIIFNISPTALNFARAVTTHDAGNFLSRLTRSINGFIEENFWARFKDVTNSVTDYNRLLSEAKSILSPRLFGLRFGSFEILVGVDVVKKIELDGFSEWQHNLLPEYEKDVVNIDYNDINQLRTIAEKYPESAREKIYDPFIKIINNPHYEFVVKDKANKIVKVYHKVEKSKEEIVIPPKKNVEQELAKGKKFINMFVELSEGQDISEINKRLLQSGLLFSQQLDELHLPLDSVSNELLRIFFKFPIQYTLSFINNFYTIFVEDLRLYLDNSDKTILFNLLQSEIIRLYNASQTAEDGDLIKTFFEKTVDHVERIPIT